MKILFPAGLFVLAINASLLLAGCEKENRTEKVGQQIEQSFEAAEADFQQAHQRAGKKTAAQESAEGGDAGPQPLQEQTEKGTAE